MLTRRLLLAGSTATVVAPKNAALPGALNVGVGLSGPAVG